MTDLEINKALARAIGWPERDIGRPLNQRLVVRLLVDEHGLNDWRTFDYRDWNVIGPIAERYDCFPHCYKRHGSRYDATWVTHQTHYFADTPQKAIALAVIEGAKA